LDANLTGLFIYVDPTILSKADICFDQFNMWHFLSLTGCTCEWLSRAVTFLGVQDNENHVWFSEERILVELNSAVARFLVSLARGSFFWIFGVIRS
jgi:hypothetical protein